MTEGGGAARPAGAGTGPPKAWPRGRGWVGPPMGGAGIITCEGIPRIAPWFTGPKTIAGAGRIVCSRGATGPGFTSSC